MEVEIIDEHLGSPFEVFSNDGNNEKPEGFGFWPRCYRKQESLNTIMEKLLPVLGLERNIDCLEIGSGHNPRPSQALSSLGAKVCTLDADWEPERHTDVADYEKDYKKIVAELGNNLLIPRRRGKNGDVECYLGDLALIDNKESELGNRKFDLIYFWGSVHYDGMCSTVEDSCAAREYKIEIPFNERVSKVLPRLKDRGVILATCSHFSGYKSQNEECAGADNFGLGELALFLATQDSRVATSIGVFTQTPEAVRKSLGLEKLSGKLAKRMLEDPFERSMANGWYGLFGNENNYQDLRNSLAKLNPEQRRKFSGLGLVDGVFVKYS